MTNMEKSTDKYYELELGGLVEDAKSQIINVLENRTTEKHNMCMEDIDALARILVSAKETGESEQYDHVVDFLWMSFHIEYNAKSLLLDLVED